ncbi:wax ester/triacylglycerol synthase domain-containing protein (plasmid) [Streptomyces sp. BI20]|uniref:wax ester/triacylglycerol synthase domain-containing protein n=1 Tax=Streptomyces sp. BI20 TaxID=3403460 RepID=UPI003C766524
MSDRLSRPAPLDLLVHEQPGLTVGALLHLRGARPTLAGLRAHVAERLPLLPALTTVLRGEGLDARWEHRAPDLRSHVREEHLPADGPTAVRAATRARGQAPFPENGPRWELTVYHGHTPDAWALLYRCHHGLQDGGGVAHTVETLFTPRPPAHEDSSGVIRTLADGRRPSLRHLATAARLMARSTARTDLWPHPLHPHSTRRTLAWADVDTAVLRSAARRHAGTANDAYVACVGQTFADWSGTHAAHADLSTFPLTVAMNIRAPAQAAAPGNRTLGSRVVLPGPHCPPEQYLRAAVRATAALKSAPHRAASSTLVTGAPRRVTHHSMRMLLAPERGAVFCSHVMYRHALAWQDRPVVAVDPLVLLPHGAPAAVLLYTYQGRSSALFVTDPALPAMHTLHDDWQRHAHDLARSPR